MREIKFRAWDKKMKAMVYGLSELFAEKVSMCKTCGQEVRESSGYTWNDYEIMQYTNLKDKNGKEIYDGDIVNVEYADGDTMIYPVEIPAIYWQEPVRTWKFEIIGNIYENPELLK